MPTAMSPAAWPLEDAMRQLAELAMSQGSSAIVDVPDDTPSVSIQRKQQKAFELQKKRDAEQREHARLEEKIELEVQALKDGQTSKERADGRKRHDIIPTTFERLP